MINTYKEAKAWLYNLQALGMKFGLENMRSICKILGNPERDFKSVHIAGTNGKGSTAAFITKALSNAGYTCGLTTSPHLMEVTERICIGDKQISRTEFTKLTCNFVESLEQYNQKNKSEQIYPTFFEATIALSFLYFSKNKIDLAVIEAGLGGRLDSTNVIKPLLSIITNISLEHTEFLGNTIKAVAGEKAGIIKNKVPLITAVTQKDALAVILKKAETKNAKAYVLGRDFSSSMSGSKVSRYKVPSHKVASHKVHFKNKKYSKRFEVSLFGTHQAANAALAIMAVSKLNKQGFDIPEQALRAGLQETNWPGRLELFSANPKWLLDCAHNPAAAKTLADFLNAYFPDKKILAVFAAMKDKQYTEMLDILSPQIKDWIFTTPQIDRAEEANLLAVNLQRINPKASINIRSKVSNALRLAKQRKDNYDLILVAGSIFLAGESYRIVSKI